MNTQTGLAPSSLPVHLMGVNSLSPQTPNPVLKYPICTCARCKWQFPWLISVTGHSNWGIQLAAGGMCESMTHMHTSADYKSSWLLVPVLICPFSFHSNTSPSPQTFFHRHISVCTTQSIHQISHCVSSFTD